MIYCYLKGGLGNMLFQIAATKSFAIDAGVEASFPNLKAQMKLINDDSFYLNNKKLLKKIDFKIKKSDLKKFCLNFN